MAQSQPRVIVIAGPTASGKSDLALALAEQFGGVIINADSQQRYRDFPILTAQPSKADLARVPHRLFGDLDAGAVSTAANWAAKAAAESLAVHQAQRVPIIVGGTGLYLKVLMQGVADIPAIPDDIRAATRTLLADMGNSAFHRLLTERDPDSGARIPVGNTQRLARAWDVLEATGTPLGTWHNAPTQPVLGADYLPVLLMPPREDLVAACAARFAAMMTAGALDEVAAAVKSGVPHDAPAMNALGARELADHLAGRLNLETAIRWAETATRQYAKRQSTWFRHQFNAELTLEARYTGSRRDEVFARVDQFLKGSP